MDDSLRAVLDSVFASPAYDWEGRTDLFAPVRRLALFLLDWLTQWGRAHPVALRLLFWTLLTLLGVLLARAALAVFRGFRRGDRDSGPLSLPTLKDAKWYRHEAARLSAAGHLLPAMQADFTALMLELDARNLVHYHPSKTPQEYVREVRVTESARTELGDLVWILYRHLFAHEPLNAAATAAWRARTAGNRYAAAG
jgi:Domain of unknown function (DUF4129)